VSDINHPPSVPLATANQFPKDFFKTVQTAQVDTAANLASGNPVLLKGQIGYETDTLSFKIGDGTTAYNSLTYAYRGLVVAGEPSQGTPHYHYALIVSAVPINNSVQVLPLAGIVPAGAKIAEGRWYIGGVVNNALYIYDTAGVNITDALTVQVTGVTNLGHWKAALDSSLNLRWGTNSFLTTTAVALVLVWYYA
jgi:hypothetical protein